jgi:hypothetical protein
MNRYIEIQNQIKRKADINWLTDSQKKQYNNCVEFLNTYHKIINLYGKEGTGKTFIGWILYKEQIATYYSSMNQVEDKKNCIIIDNYKSDRRNIRNLRNILKFKGISHVIVITRYKAEDDIPSFCLSIESEDLNRFKHNLNIHLDLDIRGLNNNADNYWEYLKSLGGKNGK